MTSFSDLTHFRWRKPNQVEPKWRQFPGDGHRSIKLHFTGKRRTLQRRLTVVQSTVSLWGGTGKKITPRYSRLDIVEAAAAAAGGFPIDESSSEKYRLGSGGGGTHPQ